MYAIVTHAVIAFTFFSRLLYRATNRTKNQLNAIFFCCRSRRKKEKSRSGVTKLFIIFCLSWCPTRSTKFLRNNKAAKGYIGIPMYVIWTPLGGSNNQLTCVSIKKRETQPPSNFKLFYDPLYLYRWFSYTYIRIYISGTNLYTHPPVFSL